MVNLKIKKANKCVIDIIKEYLISLITRNIDLMMKCKVTIFYRTAHWNASLFTVYPLDRTTVLTLH